MEAEHTVWPSRNALGRALISALLPVQANSSQLLPSRPLLQIDNGPQVLPTASLNLSPSTLNPIRFPLPYITDEDHTHSHRANGQAHAIITYFKLIIFYSHLSSMSFLLVSHASTQRLVLLYWMPNVWRNSCMSREYKRSIKVWTLTQILCFFHYWMATLRAAVGARK